VKASIGQTQKDIMYFLSYLEFEFTKKEKDMKGEGELFWEGTRVRGFGKQEE
jgi:hypothetical protein